MLFNVKKQQFAHHTELDLSWKHVWQFLRAIQSKQVQSHKNYKLAFALTWSHNMKETRIWLKEPVKSQSSIGQNYCSRFFFFFYQLQVRSIQFDHPLADQTTQLHVLTQQAANAHRFSLWTLRLNLSITALRTTNQEQSVIGSQTRKSIGSQSNKNWAAQPLMIQTTNPISRN